MILAVHCQLAILEYAMFQQQDKMDWARSHVKDPPMAKDNSKMKEYERILEIMQRKQAYIKNRIRQLNSQTIGEMSK